MKVLFKNLKNRIKYTTFPINLFFHTHNNNNDAVIYAFNYYSTLSLMHTAFATIKTGFYTISPSHPHTHTHSQILKVKSILFGMTAIL